MQTLIKIAVFVAIAVSFILGNIKSTAQEIPVVREILIPEVPKVLTHQELVKKYSSEFSVSAELITELITLENAGKWDEKLQSYCVYDRDRPEIGVKKGDRELSFGLAQIHLPAHKNITYEQATDADFSIKFIASEISQGRGWQWSCYRTAKFNVANGKSGGKCTQ